MKTRFTALGLALMLAACDSTGPDGGSGNVAVSFNTSAPHASANLLPAGGPGLSSDQLTLTGSNGTIVIDDIRLIVSELELRSSDDGACDGDDDVGEHDVAGDDDCKFEGGPFIVDLSLEGNTSIATDNVPAGTYDSFKFEIKNLDNDDDEVGDTEQTDERARVPGLLTEIRTSYPNFPSRASMVVKGTQDGQPFTVYFKAEIEIESPIDPPLVVPSDNSLTVDIDPSKWFTNGTQVTDMLALNGQLVDFELEIRDGLLDIHPGSH